MADDADLAQAWDEVFGKVCLSKSKRENGPKVTGECSFCGVPLEPIEPPKRWCGVECRDLWEVLVEKEQWLQERK